VINNEFYLWFVKGYIAQEKNEAMNWAKAIVFTAREKAQRKEVKVTKSVGSINLIKLNAREASGGMKGVFVWKS
jgi:hypothetical protein